MTEDIDIDYNKEDDKYYIILDGKRHGPVNAESLSEFADELHTHFHLFRGSDGADKE